MPSNTTTLRLIGGSRVAVVGAGCTGLATAAGLARLGHAVQVVDPDVGLIEQLGDGIVPTLEEGVDELVREGLSTGLLSFTHDLAAAARRCDLALVCLGDGSDDVAEPVPGTDATALRGVLTMLGAELGTRAVVVLRSPVWVGVAQWARRHLGRRDVGVVVNPGFLRQGTATRDMLRPDRIVIGSDDRWAAERTSELYSSIESPISLMSATSAELVKQASTAMLALRVGFANEVAVLCEALGADVAAVLRGIGGDTRIGHAFLRPGPGWGGPAFHEDLASLSTLGRSTGQPLRLAEAAVLANREHTDWAASKLRRLMGHRRGHVAIWGLSFKASTQGLRQSPAMAVIDRLDDLVTKVTAFEPGAVAPQRIDDVDGRVELVADPYDALDDADVLFIANDWPVFAHLDLDIARSRMRVARIFDACNLLDHRVARGAGFDIVGIGRAGPTPVGGLSGLAAAD